MRHIMRANTSSNPLRVLKDGLLLIFSLILAAFIITTDIAHAIVGYFRELEYIVSFFAGLFFTSIFTAAPSVALLGELARENSPWVVALFGGLGAMLGDFVLFRFLRDRVAKDLEYLFTLPRAKRVLHIFSTILPRMLWPFLGAIIIISPLPDEIGITLLGLSKIDQRLFLPLSFVLNGIGILLIGFAAKSVNGL